MRQTKRPPKAKRQPLVGIAIDGASSFGRGVMRGAMEYVNAQRRWDIYPLLRRTFETDSLTWPKCDGAILAGAGTPLVNLIRKRTRFLITCSGSASADDLTVCLDDVAVGTMAAEHLLDCRLDVFSFYGSPQSAHSRNRERGFAETVTNRGGRFIPCSLAFPGDADNMEHWSELISWLHTLPKPIGIMAVDDTVAYDLAAACRHADIGVPERVAIIGVNNDDLLCQSSGPPLSSVGCRL